MPLPSIPGNVVVVIAGRGIAEKSAHILGTVTCPAEVQWISEGPFHPTAAASAQSCKGLLGLSRLRLIAGPQEKLRLHSVTSVMSSQNDKIKNYYR